MGLLRHSVIFSGGSKGQLFAWKLVVSNDNAFSECFWESLGTYSIYANSRKHLKPWKQHLYSPEVETRFMDLSTFCLDDVMGQSWSHFHAVVAVCSLGVVRQAAILYSMQCSQSVFLPNDIFCSLFTSESFYFSFYKDYL